MTIATDITAIATLGYLVDDTAGGTVPDPPTFTMAKGSNTVTLTIDGDASVTNEVRYRTTSQAAWQDGGSSIGDGDVTISGLIDDVPYYFTVYSVLSTIPSTPAPVQPVTFSTTAANDWDTAADDMVTPQFDAFKKSGTYLPSAGGSRDIDIMITFDDNYTTSGNSGGPLAQVTVHNDATTGISQAEIIQGRDQLTMVMKNGTTDNRMIRRILSSDHAWNILEVV